MIRTISPQPTLWESVIPQCLMGLPGDLAEIDALLDDEAFFEPFRPFFDPVIGRPSVPIVLWTSRPEAVVGSRFQCARHVAHGPPHHGREPLRACRWSPIIRATWSRNSAFSSLRRRISSRTASSRRWSESFDARSADGGEGVVERVRLLRRFSISARMAG